ncbi:unnamed protein product [Acidithrix sp. C25]|nr:unnamed protein product [Acidithrix sp. C25]
MWLYPAEKLFEVLRLQSKRDDSVIRQLTVQVGPELHG